jgi:hypothetical protein
MDHSIWSMIKRALFNHLGHLLLAVSWCFILFVFIRPALLGPQFVDCVPSKEEAYTMLEVNKAYPIWTQAVGVAHIPSILITRFATKFIQGIFSLSCAPTAKVELPLFFVFSSIQWLLVASAIDSGARWLKSRQNRRRIQQARTRRERASFGKLRGLADEAQRYAVSLVLELKGESNAQKSAPAAFVSNINDWRDYRSRVATATSIAANASSGTTEQLGSESSVY